MPTKRRRFFWAAWWTEPPAARPFRKPDASNGGAASREQARTQAERVAGRALAETDPRWAAAWMRVLRGRPPWPTPLAGADPEGGAARARPRGGAPARAIAAPEGSRPWAFALLGVPPTASLAEITRAFRAAALRTHPDRGGDQTAFIAARRAYEVALAAATTPTRRRRRRRRRAR